MPGTGDRDNGAGINRTGDRDSRTRRLRGHTGQLGGSPGRSRDGQRGWKSPSLAWGLTGTSRGVPASGAGDTQCSPTQVRLQLLQRELGVRAGHGRGSAGAERAPPFPPSGGAEEDEEGEEEEGEGGEGSSEMARRRTALRSQSELERSGCAPRVRPLAARGGRGRGSPSRCGPKKQLRKGRRPRDTRRDGAGLPALRPPLSPSTRARGAGGAPEPQGTARGSARGHRDSGATQGTPREPGAAGGCGEWGGTGRDRQGQAGTGRGRQGWAVPGKGGQAGVARVGSARLGWSVPGKGGQGVRQCGQ
ncbi:uncharacterized protein LOC143694180 [Agelaius phoeniceus]|uniref:uncharacterized protein LOC143694180 n=1 Tax=Agelaius phoeniceus TaxID=39638 RepID=UPI0040550E4F